jgi:DNA mismatch repair protein MutS
MSLVDHAKRVDAGAAAISASARDRQSGTPFSILFDDSEASARASTATQPRYFRDLNLDQIVGSVTSPWAVYDLAPLFWTPLHDAGSVRYRHGVFKDLENEPLLKAVESFTQQMRDVRARRDEANKLYEPFHKDAWLLHAVTIYCEGVIAFSESLEALPAASRGGQALQKYLQNYSTGSPFNRLLTDARTLTDDLARVEYSVLIRDSSFTVGNFAAEKDYSAEIEATFEKFKQGGAKDYRVKYRWSPIEMNHIEGKILEFVSFLNPGLFARLRAFAARNADFIDETLARFDREIHFYLAYLDYIGRLRAAGLSFCYPKVSRSSKQTSIRDGFDLALAAKLTKANTPVVCNDFDLAGPERIVVISGPNQGGKTTFARMFGQLHHLARLGCLLPARQAAIFLCDDIFTHFEREERVENLQGKLEDDLTRVHAILEQATPRSVVVMNEVFTSTTIQDETFLSGKVMEKITNLGLLCAWVTFVDELASFGDNTVSMVSTIVPENPAMRTFKIVRKPADGLAYAMAIARKYGLSYEQLKARVWQ